MVTEAYLGFFLYKIGLKTKILSSIYLKFTYLSFNDEKMQKK